MYDAWQRLHGAPPGRTAEDAGAGPSGSQMISQWAHHMKTPVSVIDLELQKAAKRPASPTDRRCWQASPKKTAALSPCCKCFST